MPRLTFRSRAYQLAQEPEVARQDHALGQARRQLPGHALRVDRVRRLHGALLQRLPPVAPCSSRCSRATRRRSFARAAAAARAASRRVADQVDFHRVAERQHVGSISICTPRALPSFGQEFRIGKARADHQQACRTPSSGRSSASCRAARSIRSPTADRRAARPCRAAPWRRRRQLVGDCDHLVGGVQRAGADQHRDFLAALSTSAARRRSAS